MIIGVVFKDGKEIDRGISTGGKKWCEAYPEQRISICDECSAYGVENERDYNHGNGISFQELQDNGNGWEVVYDSNERIDKTVEYPLPKWFTHGGEMPIYEHKMNEDGTVDSELKGYLK